MSAFSRGLSWADRCLIGLLLVALIVLFRMAVFGLLSWFPARDVYGQPTSKPTAAATASRPAIAPPSVASRPAIAPPSAASRPAVAPPSVASQPAVKAAVVTPVATDEVLKLLQVASQNEGTSTPEGERLKSLPLEAILPGLLMALRLDDPGMAEIASRFLRRFQTSLIPHIGAIKQVYLQAPTGQRPLVAAVLVAAGTASLPILREFLTAKPSAQETAEEEEERAALILTVGRLGSQGAALLPILVGFCKDKKAAIRANALVAVGFVGQKTPEILGILKASFGDQDAVIRLSAAKAAQVLGWLDPAFWAVLRQALEGSDGKSLLLALEIAAALQAQATPLRPWLVKLQTHSDTEVSDLAKQILASWEQTKAPPSPRN